MEGENGIGEVGCKFPFLRTVHGGVESVVEVQPFVGCGWLAQESVILEGFLGVGGKAV
jgi:hypothetical protein